MKFIKFAIIPILAVGCGVSDSKPLNDIDADLWNKICEAAVDPDEAPIECDGFTIEPTTVAQCVEGSNITYTEGCTFGQWRDCQDYDPADPCDFTDLGPCESFFADCVPAPE